jgi:hypothetical protein
MPLIQISDLDIVLGNIIAKDEYSGKKVISFAMVAEENYLSNELGLEFYEVLLKYHESNPDNLDAEKYDALLERVKRVAVWGTYYEYLFFALGKDTANGMVEEVSENTKAVRIGILDARQKKTKLILGQEIDRLMSFLFRKRADYSAWTSSPTGLESLSLFIRSGVELGKALPESFGSYWMWKRMKQNFIQKTDEVLLPVLKQELLTKLKQDISADNLVDPYKQLRKLCANYLAYWTYGYILPTLTVVISETEGLRVKSEFDGINNAKDATDNQIMRLTNGISVATQDALKSLSSYLKDNASDLPELPIESPTEVTDKMKLMPFQRNRDRKRIFGL